MAEERRRLPAWLLLLIGLGAVMGYRVLARPPPPPPTPPAPAIGAEYNLTGTASLTVTDEGALAILAGAPEKTMEAMAIFNFTDTASVLPETEKTMTAEAVFNFSDSASLAPMVTKEMTAEAVFDFADSASLTPAETKTMTAEAVFDFTDTASVT